MFLVSLYIRLTVLKIPSVIYKVCPEKSQAIVNIIIVSVTSVYPGSQVEWTGMCTSEQ